MWSPCPGAKSYKVFITVEFTNKQGELEKVEHYWPSIPATPDEIHSVTFTTKEILNKFVSKRSFKNTDWTAWIRVEAY